jgi:hypothetical protein
VEKLRRRENMMAAFIGQPADMRRDLRLRYRRRDLLGFLCREMVFKREADVYFLR